MQNKIGQETYVFKKDGVFQRQVNNGGWQWQS